VENRKICGYEISWLATKTGFFHDSKPIHFVFLQFCGSRVASRSGSEI